MKLENFKEKKNKKVKVTLFIFLIVGVFGIAYLIHRTFASYQENKNFKMIEGTINLGTRNASINYKLYLDGVETEDFPAKESGYVFLASKSNCNDEAKISWDYETWWPVLKNKTATTNTCTLHFVKPSSNIVLTNEYKTTLEEAKTQIAALETPDFSTIPTTNGLYKTTDNLGDSYYYRGNVTNNYAQFAGFNWRILRINGDGSLRLIYDGVDIEESSPTPESTPVVSPKSIKTSPYNPSHTDPAYTGYMYGNTLNTNYLESTKNDVESLVKKELDAWYKTNILDKNYAGYLSDEIFCNDRSIASGDGFTTTTNTGYASINRLNTTVSPTLKCTRKEDRFTQDETTGNGALKYPIGLITADELSMAGAVSNEANRTFYLYTNEDIWTMTAYNFAFNTTFASNWIFNKDGVLSFNTVTNTYGLRPVINIHAGVTITGEGTEENPYQFTM